jgi:hypothetical protein
VSQIDWEGPCTFTKDDIAKFNENHDELGRFADASAPIFANVEQAKEAGLPEATFYHGTSAALLASIEKEGIIPAKIPGADAVASNKGVRIQGMSITDYSAKLRPPSVYITEHKAFAESIARYVKTLHPKAGAALLEVHVPLDAWKGLHADELSHELRYEGVIKPQWITHTEILKRASDPTDHVLYVVIPYLDDSEVKKFNENHDELGRFASGDSAQGAYSSQLGIGGVASLNARLDGIEAANQKAGDYSKLDTMPATIEGYPIKKVALMNDNRPDEGTMAQSSRKGGIEINVNSPGWKDPNYPQKAFASGWMSDADKNHVVYHELGHMKWLAQSTADQRDDANDTGAGRHNAFNGHPTFLNAASSVSQYATASGAEFVAEVYAAMKSGRTYDPQVMDLYHQFGGPSL